MAIGDKPVKVFKHRGISVSIFENSTEKDGQKQTFYKASVRRTFKQGDEFVSNANFGRDEIPVLRLLLDRAWQLMLQAESRSPGSPLADVQSDTEMAPMAVANGEPRSQRRTRSSGKTTARSSSSSDSNVQTESPFE